MWTQSRTVGMGAMVESGRQASLRIISVRGL